MQKFLKMIFSFFFILFGLLLIIVVTIEIPFLNDYSFNKLTATKINSLKINESKTIIVAGDSRAEMMVIPDIIKSETGLNCINIATSSCDLVTTSAALTSYKDSNIFLISASSWQINDGAIDPGLLSIKCFLQLTLLEKILIYKNNLRNLKLMYIRTLRILFDYYTIRAKTDKKAIEELGFSGKEDTLNVEEINTTNIIVNHGFYKNLFYKGSRYKIFIESLEKLSRRKSLVIIYNPPASPFWKKATKNTEINRFEVEYSNRLDSLCKKTDNIVFIDFYTQDSIQLDDDKYFDIQHLNRKGAEIFSKILSIRIKEILKSRDKC